MSESFGVFGAMKGLFEYNRENFIFDRTMNQARVYQIQKMRVAQVKLYRDDLRELFDLTIRKMDSYLIFNALLLLFTGGLFYEGQLPTGTPAWLLWMWTMTLGSAFLFLSLAVWFAIHASITAQTFQVRLLTQWLRLPIPSADDIHAVAGVATEFEETRAKDMLRVPGVVKAGSDPFHCVEKFPDVPNELLKSEIVSDYTLFVEHFYLFRELQKHWQGFDAYCRVGMVVGTNMLMSAFSYMSLAYFLMSFKDFGGLIFPFIFTGFQLMHLKFNLRNLTLLEQVSIVALNVVPVALACVAGVQAILDNTSFYGDILSPVMNALSGLWVVFLVLLGSEDDGGLPHRFVTVASIDVLGLEEDGDRFNALSPTGRDREREGAETPVAVAVPASVVISKAEDRRRRKSHVFDEGVGMNRDSMVSATDVNSIVPTDVYIADSSSSVSAHDILASVNKGVFDSHLSGINELYSSPSSEDASHTKLPEASYEALEGIAPVEQADELRAYKASIKARMLPWKGFREAGAVLVCLWIFATTYSVLASFEPRWGWPKTMPYGDGEEEESLAPQAVAAPSVHATTTFDELSFSAATLRRTDR